MRWSELIRRCPAQAPGSMLTGRPMLPALCGLAVMVLTENVHASTLEGINHTHWAINHFSINGRSGLDIIGPYQGGGGGVVTSPLRAGSRG